ncbi:hypothetical protein A1F94_007273 [Pyrenophora tritici-repentis]|nr:hypothetical protein A1F99_091960 [Pyrenophora tritici-repentis]KAG9381619.1 hypothetical protein A1F94_007273 [Pyrenophora tritici-repentis]KAI1558544.1 CASP-C domain containing protein [Pyrenophora tritici-repentis]PZD23054.1 hypothetical protein A1F96_10600 [Pyrenophora tritici-repentis]PZD25864.1 hypothetical protein A1F97_10978 [Pyrenophora tritici-repentis]
MSHSQSHQASVQPSEGSIEPRHQQCCVQAAVYMSNLYHHNLAQLQNAHRHLQATQNEVGNARRQIVATEQELQRERDTSELLNQQLIELQECHYRLQKELERLNQSVKDSKMFADEVAEKAEILVNNFRTRLAGGEVEGLHVGQSISGLILESAKNALLVKAVSSQHSGDEQFTELSYVMDQNLDFQQRNMELSKQVETLSQQVKDGKSEVASLNKALELAAEDGRRKKPRRGKTSAVKN